MRVLIVGWMIGSGSTGVQASEIATYLENSGHQVACLSGGRCDWRIAPYIADRSRKGVRFLELRNPPIMPCTNSGDPASDVTLPALEDLLRGVVRQVNPEVVAVLDYVGWPASVVRICHDLGVKVLVCVHNMWTMCTRLSLFDRWGSICTDYQDGARCVECMGNVVGSNAARWRLRMGGLLMKPNGLALVAKRLYFGTVVREHRADAVRVAAKYRLRRATYIQALSEADGLCCVSSRVKELLESFGVRNSRWVVMRACTGHLLAIQQSCRLPERWKRIERPVRFGYIGGHSVIKGLHVLLKAFQGISPEDATLAIYGHAGVGDLIRLKACVDPRHPAVFHGPYRHSELARILGAIDVGVVPSVCEDSFPTTTLEFQAAGVPVIGSRVGGVPEQIDHGRNGLLFEPGDPKSLRAALDKVIASPEIVAGWRSELPPAPSPLGHWQKVERLLGQLAEEAP